MMDKKYIMALDQGTTSCRCILYDKQGRQISVAQKEFKQFYPHEGWVELFEFLLSSAQHFAVFIKKDGTGTGRALV